MDGFVSDEVVSTRCGIADYSGKTMARFWSVLPGAEGGFGRIRQTMREDQTPHAMDDAGNAVKAREGQGGNASRVGRRERGESKPKKRSRRIESRVKKGGNLGRIVVVVNIVDGVGGWMIGIGTGME